MIAIGQIARSNGIRGEVRVTPLTDVPQRFTRLKTVWIGLAVDGSRQFSLQAVRFHRSQAILKLEGIENRTASDQLKNCFIFVEEEKSVSPSEGSYFIHDIVGMEVSTEEGILLGVVHEVWRLPANDVWVVRQNGKEILLPAIKQIVRSVDTTKRTIVIHAMEGLIE